MTPQEAITYNLVAHNRKCRNNPTLALFLAFAGTRHELSEPRLQAMSYSKMEEELRLRLVDALPYPEPSEVNRRQRAAAPADLAPVQIARAACFVKDSNSEVISAQLEALRTTNSIDIKNLPDIPNDFIFSSRHQFAFMFQQEVDSAWNQAREAIMRRMSNVTLAPLHLQHYTPTEIAYHLKTIVSARPLITGMPPNAEGLRYKFLELIEAILVGELGVFGQMDYKRGLFTAAHTQVKLNFDITFQERDSRISLVGANCSGLQSDLSLRKLCETHL